MNYGIVYAYINKHNMKMYIGQTTQPIYKRRREHWSAAFKKQLNYPFMHALRKYGKDAFEEVILCQCADKESLDREEAYCIQIFDTINRDKGYNIGLGGQKSGMHSEETKRKISEAAKRLHANHEHKCLISELGKKNYHFLQTLESRRNHADSMRGKPCKNKKGLLLGSKVSRKKIIAISPSEVEIGFYSSRDAAAYTGVSFQQISNILNGRNFSGKDWRFTYVS